MFLVTASPLSVVVHADDGAEVCVVVVSGRGVVDAVEDIVVSIVVVGRAVVMGVVVVGTVVVVGCVVVVVGGVVGVVIVVVVVGNVVVVVGAVVV